MSDIRINALATTATSAASDDYLALDGSANGTRKILATNVAQNVTDVTFGSSGPSAKSSINARAARQGLVFDGTAGASGLTSIAGPGTGDFSFSAVINTTSASTSQVIYGSAANGAAMYLESTGQVNIGLADVGNLFTGYYVTANKTTLLTYVRSSGVGKLYADGVQVYTGTDARNFSGTYSRIGVYNNAVTNPFLGSISQTLIYNRALSAAEVVSLFEAGVPAGNDFPGTAAGTAIGNQAAIDASGLTSFSSSSGQFSGTTNSTGAFYVRFSTGRINTGNLFRITGTVSYGGAYPTYAGVTQQGSGTGQAGIPIVNGNFDVVITAHSYQAVGLIDFYIGGTNGVSWTINSITITPLGLLLAPDAGQAGGGLTWYDTSGNAANITLPASGVSWAVPSSRYLGGNWTTSGNLTVSGGKASLTSAGNQTLEVISSSGAAQAIAFFSGSGGGSGIIAHNSSQSLRIGRASDSALTGYTDELFIAASSGNLLVGTTTDGGQKLQVNGTAYVSGDATFAGNIKTAAPSGGTAATWRLGTVASVSPTSPNRTIEVEIGGTTYYIHAKTTNN